MPDGRTALMIAAMFNRTAIVDLLVRHGRICTGPDAGGVSALRMRGWEDGGGGCAGAVEGIWG